MDTQFDRVMVEISEKICSIGERNDKPLQILAWEHHDSMKRQKDRTLKEELPRSVGAQHATGGQRRTNSRKNEQTETKKKNTQL